MNSIRLEKTLINLQTQMKLDKASLYANNLKIKALEDLVIEVGADPANMEVAKALIKQKNEDIATLRKQLKLPQSENPQEKEIPQQKTENDELKQPVHEMTAQIKEMESQLEASIRENEGLKKTQHVHIHTVIPTVSTDRRASCRERVSSPV